jgi:hypothetical protein
MFLAGCGSDEISTQTDSINNLSDQEKEGLLYMREEEELARDLYIDIYEAKGSQLTIFKNISENAESKHAEAIRVLLENNSIHDPSTNVHNTYNNLELQYLYDNLFTSLLVPMI